MAGITLERPLHTLRHSYARALRRIEAPLEAVQAALDHSNLATTSIYVRQPEGHLNRNGRAITVGIRTGEAIL